jgi:hypothetical protein
MKKLLFIVCFLTYLSTSAQVQPVLDTAPLAGSKKVVLPTYNNLVKLSGIDSLQMENFLEPYDYVHEGTAGSFSSEDDNFDIYKGHTETDVMFSIKTDYFKALSDDIKKRFPNAVRTTTNAYGQAKETYMITWTDAKGQHIQQLSITEDTASGGASFTVLK